MLSSMDRSAPHVPVSRRRLGKLPARSCQLGVVIALAMSIAACSSGEEDAQMAATTPTAGMGASVPCTAKPGMLRGHSAQTLMAGGLSRSFHYYAPQSLDPNQPAPVVFVAHGYLMNGDLMRQISGFEALAEQHGFVVIFPDGQGDRAAAPTMDPPWNVGQNVCQPIGAPAPLAMGDDQAFIDAMLDFARADQCVDENHVFMTGFSMGGYFSNHNGCVRSDLRAVAPHSAGSYDLSACPATPKPIMLVHFEQDGLIPYTCGTEARDRWLARNGCDAAAPPETRMVTGGLCEYYQGCPAGAQVAMCTLQAPEATSDEFALGHGWAGGATTSPAISMLSIPEAASASELVWGFFTEFAW